MLQKPGHCRFGVRNCTNPAACLRQGWTIADRFRFHSQINALCRKKGRQRTWAFRLQARVKRLLKNFGGTGRGKGCQPPVQPLRCRHGPAFEMLKAGPRENTATKDSCHPAGSRCRTAYAARKTCQVHGAQEKACPKTRPAKGRQKGGVLLRRRPFVPQSSRCCRAATGLPDFSPPPG